MSLYRLSIVSLMSLYRLSIVSLLSLYYGKQVPPVKLPAPAPPTATEAHIGLYGGVRGFIGARVLGKNKGA